MLCYTMSCSRGISAAGSAQHWQCWGQRFESAMLHQNKSESVRRFGFFVFSAAFRIKKSGRRGAATLSACIISSMETPERPRLFRLRVSKKRLSPLRIAEKERTFSSRHLRFPTPSGRERFPMGAGKALGSLCVCPSRTQPAKVMANALSTVKNGSGGLYPWGDSSRKGSESIS